MTRDRARKQAIRARMIARGEPYSVAARRLADPTEAGPTEAGPDAIGLAEADATEPGIGAIRACGRRTLAAPGARVSWRLDLELPGTTAADRKQARGLRGLVRRGLGSAFNRFLHPAYEGFAEPGAQRYQIANRAHAQLFADGRLYRGRPGRLLTTLPPDRPGDGEDVDHNLLWPLWALSGAAEATFDGTETVRDSFCRRYVVQADLDRAAAELSTELNAGGDWPVGFVGDPPPHPPVFLVWTDGRYVRRVRFAKQSSNRISPSLDGYGSLAHLELWDFGVPVDHLDWSRLPDFGTA